MQVDRTTSVIREAVSVLLMLQVHTPVRLGAGEHGTHVYRLRDGVGGGSSLHLRLLLSQHEATVEPASRQGPRRRRAAVRALLQLASRVRVPCHLPDIKLHLSNRSRLLTLALAPLQRQQFPPRSKCYEEVTRKLLPWNYLAYWEDG